MNFPCDKTAVSFGHTQEEEYKPLAKRRTQYNLSSMSTDRIFCPKQAAIIETMTWFWIWGDPGNTWSKLVYHPAAPQGRVHSGYKHKLL